MLKTKSGRGIQFKFLMILLFVFLVGTSVIILVFAINNSRMQKESLTTMGYSLVSYIAKLSKDPVLQHDTVGLDAIVNDANKNEYIAYAVISDTQGTPLTSLYASINYYLPAVKTVLVDSPEVNGISDVIKLINEKEAVLEVSRPISIISDAATDKTIGMVTIGMFEGGMNQQMIKTVEFIVLLNVAIALLLMGILFIVSKRIVFDPII